MIEAIIFDFGGVLLTDSYVRCRLAGFDAVLGWPEGSLFERLYSGAAWEAVSTGRWSLDEFWNEVGVPVAGRLPADFGSFRNSFHGESMDEAVLRLAWRLRTRYRIALLSNATILLPRRLQSATELAGLFDVTVISALEGMRKPNPDIYRLTCQRLNLAPEACVFIDDKTRNTDVALTLGMKAIEHRDATTTAAVLRSLGVMF